MQTVTVEQVAEMRTLAATRSTVEPVVHRVALPPHLRQALEGLWITVARNDAHEVTVRSPQGPVVQPARQSGSSRVCCDEPQAPFCAPHTLVRHHNHQPRAGHERAARRARSPDRRRGRVPLAGVRACCSALVTDAVLAPSMPAISAACANVPRRARRWLTRDPDARHRCRVPSVAIRMDRGLESGYRAGPSGRTHAVGFAGRLYAGVYARQFVPG